MVNNMSVQSVVRKCHSCAIEKSEKEFHRMKPVDGKPDIWLCSKKCVNQFIIMTRIERSKEAAIKVPVIVLSLTQSQDDQPKSGSIFKRIP